MRKKNLPHRRRSHRHHHNDDRDTDDPFEKGMLNVLGEQSVCVQERQLQLEFVVLFVGCLTSQQHASVSQGRIYSDNFTCCHSETEVADQTVYLPQSQYTDTGPTSPNADPITPGAWQDSHWSAIFEVTGIPVSPKNPGASGIRTLSRRTPYN